MLEQGMPAWQATALLDLQQYYVNGQGGTQTGCSGGYWDAHRSPCLSAEHAAAFREQAAKA
jgi:hypothetical protein